MPRRTKEEAAITRENLLKAGLKVFSKKGYSSTTLEDIAREAGVTRGAIYWHFGSKAELYIALLNEYSGRSAGIVQAAAAEGGSLEQILRRVFVRLLVAVDTDPLLREVMEISLFKTERSPELSAAMQGQQAANKGLVANIAAAMQQGIAAGELRADLDPMEMARAFLALQNGAITLWFQDSQSFSLGGSAPALAEIFLCGITRR